MSSEVEVRWRQRLTNFGRACALLAEIDGYPVEVTPEIVREGFVQRFEIAFDLAWKPLSDYLEHEGIAVRPTPRAVIKEAYQARVIGDGQLFMDMLETRNEMSHRYDEAAFDQAFLKIRDSYAAALAALCQRLEQS